MSKTFVKDFIWYFLGAIIPAFIGVLKTPIFTRHFSKLDYGYFGLVSVTYTFLGVLLFTGIGSSIWRYYLKYSKRNKLKTLHSNLFFIYTLSVFILLIISIGWFVNEKNDLVKELILYSFVSLILNQLFSFYMIMVRIEGKSSFYNIFQSTRAILIFTLLLILVFYLNSSITALITSIIIIDILSLLYIFIKSPIRIPISIKTINKGQLKRFFTYGGVGLFVNVSLLIITLSDKYIIAYFSSIENVGIYDQVFKLGTLTVAIFVSVFFNTINPTIINELERGISNSTEPMRKYLKIYLLAGFPIVFYLSFFSKELASLLLGKDFREGYIILPLVFFSSYLVGFINFYELRFKFRNKITLLFKIIFSFSIFNVLSTILFVNLYNYFWAAFTTILTYIFIIILLHTYERGLFLYSIKYRKQVIKAIFIFAFQLFIFYQFNKILPLNAVQKIFIILFFILMYLFSYSKQFIKLRIH